MSRVHTDVLADMPDTIPVVWPHVIVQTCVCNR
jgi:hypothetical protein